MHLNNKITRWALSFTTDLLLAVKKGSLLSSSDRTACWLTWPLAAAAAFLIRWSRKNREKHGRYGSTGRIIPGNIPGGGGPGTRIVAERGRGPPAGPRGGEWDGVPSRGDAWARGGVFPSGLVGGGGACGRVVDCALVAVGLVGTGPKWPGKGMPGIGTGWPPGDIMNTMDKT